jgi:hypothetical protein
MNIAKRRASISRQIPSSPGSYAATPLMLYLKFFKSKPKHLPSIAMEIWKLHLMRRLKPTVHVVFYQRRLWGGNWSGRPNQINYPVRMFLVHLALAEDSKAIFVAVGLLLAVRISLPTLCQ